MIAELATLMPYVFPIIGTVFSAIFILLIIVILAKALKTSDIRGLFTSQDEQGGISLTKFWQNIAYGAATVAFLSLNMAGKATGASLEIVWVIYLGIVASNAVLSKWISMKYSGPQQPKERDYTGPYDRYPRDTGYGGGGYDDLPRRPPIRAPRKSAQADDPDA